MKEENGSQDVGATEFDYPNNVNPRPRSPIFYGSTPVPHPTNEPAKRVDSVKVMNETLYAKG